MKEPSAQDIERWYAAMAAYWHPVIRESELDAAGGCKGVTLLGRPLVVVRLSDGVRVFDDACRHFGARLSLGRVISCNGADALQCPYHGWTYAADGTCIHIPQLPEGRRVPAAARVQTYAVEVRFGLIWVRLAQASSQFPLPEFPEFDNPRFRAVTLDEPQLTSASALRMIMATLDDTHFPWVHPGILGDPAAPLPPEHRVARERATLVCDYEIEQPHSPATTGTDGAQSSTDSVAVRYRNTVAMPNVIHLAKESTAGRYTIWLAASPVTHDQTRNFWTFARDYDLDPAKDAEYAAFSQTVRDQDKPIVESQRPVLVPPLASGVHLPVSPGDAPLVEYVRWLDELGLTVTCA